MKDKLEMDVMTKQEWILWAKQVAFTIFSIFLCITFMVLLFKYGLWLIKVI